MLSDEIDVDVDENRDDDVVNIVDNRDCSENDDDNRDTDEDRDDTDDENRDTDESREY
jgi:hypothetical protein